MKRKLLTSSVIAAALISVTVVLAPNKGNQQKPLNYEEEEYDKEKQWRKVEPWTADDAARHQKILSRLKHKIKQNPYRKPGDQESFGGVHGRWYNKAPNNMPGAFKFADILDGTDTIYAVTHNHYVTEFNSKSYIWKGTVYNPNSGTMGDDFIRLTGHWPNRYKDMFVFNNDGQTRIVVGVENGPVYYSDNDGKDWNKATGLPSSIQSTIINRNDEVVYTTDGEDVYKSEDGGESFTHLDNVGNGGDAALYSPRYNSQPGSDNVYLAIEGEFFQLNTNKTGFNLKGSYSGGHNNRYFSIGGDARKIYVTVNEKYYTSVNGGTSWSEKYPKGNYYGDRTEILNAGKYIAVNPEDEDNVVAGYVHPVFSTDGLSSTKSTTSGWGRYQNGTHLNKSAYEDRIRYNYHPDFQSHHFFYNSSNDLFTVGCTDGGIYVSYKDWFNHPNDVGDYINFGGRASSHYINITTVGAPSSLIYRHAMFTGYKDPNHINYGTQDQGSQDYIYGTGGDTISVYQSIGGDGPSLGSADGNWVWKWDRAGGRVWAPVELYDGNTLRSIGKVNSMCEDNKSATLSTSSSMGWCPVYIDRYAPSKRMWVLGSRLTRAEVDNSGSVSGSQKEIGSFGVHITAFTQSNQDPDVVYFLKQGLVYKSTDRGDSWSSSIPTPYVATGNPHSVGAGWVLPGNDNWILFAGPAGNNVSAILSKDAGATWIDVTGDLPTGNDFQVSGLIGSEDGKFVFAGTDLGPYVFNVATEKWHPMFGGEAAMFNTMSMEYIESTKTIRFGTWGTGVWDFAIDDGVISNSTEIDASNVEVFPTYLNSGTSIQVKGYAGILGLFSINGQKITSINAKADGVKIETHGLKPGTYILRSAKDNAVQQKIVVK